MRTDGRRNDQIRPVSITRNYLKFPPGSVLISMGDTRVICSATIEEKVPAFLKDSGQGWVTAEYGMLPASTPERTAREAVRGRAGGRSYEIQRLIGRSLRAVTDLWGFGERTIRVDCDVIQADGGTRTASITGAFVALVDAFNELVRKEEISRIPIKDMVAAISVGIVDREMILDLNYEEDSMAEVDMNVVMTTEGLIIEIQGTAEETPFSRRQLEGMIALASKGINELFEIQKEAMGYKKKD